MATPVSAELLEEDVARARHRLVAAALQAAAGDYTGVPAEAVQADDQLFLAAQRLTEAVNRLPRERQPTGWRPAEVPDGH